MSENESGFRRLLSGEDHPDRKDLVREYVTHRLQDGAHLKDVLEEEYVVRNSTQVERDEIVRDPRIVQRAKEGLEQDFGSDELAPTPPTAAE